MTNSDITINMDDLGVEKDIGNKQPLNVEPVDIGDIREPMVIPNTTPRRGKNDALHDLSGTLPYAPEDMWHLLEKANPVLYKFAQNNQLSLDEVMQCPYSFDNLHPQLQNFAKKNKLPLDQMMEYAHLIENFDVEPEALADFLKNHYVEGIDAKLVLEKLESIKEKNPDDYTQLILDFLRRTCFAEEKKGPSPLHAAHVAIQSKEISSQKSKIIYQYVALAVSVLLSAAGYAWGIYGQATGTPTHAPTSAPTTPLQMPTGPA